MNGVGLPASPRRTLRETRAELEAGRLSAADVVWESLTLAEACQNDCNAFSTIVRDGAARAAATSDDRYAAGSPRLLEGLPFAVKDMFDTRSIETRYGSRAYIGNVPAKDATVVGALLDTGMVLVGKTTTHEFAWGVTTDSEAFGATRNPLDTSRIPGGSSGGMAAAVAYGVVAAGLGTDTGGSVRIPAALCGVVGFKPSRDLLPLTGVFPLAASLDHAGVIGRRVDDVVTVMAGLRLWMGDGGLPRPSATIVEAPGGLWPSTEIQERMRRAICAIARIADVDNAEQDLLPRTAFGHFATIVLAEGGMKHFALSTPDERRELYDGETTSRLEMAERVTLGEYAAAQEGRRSLSARIARRLQIADFLITPTVPCTAPKVGMKEVVIGDWSGGIREALMTYTAPFNLSGNPAISIPLPTPSGALPAGLQIVGRHGEDAKLLRFALSVEDAIAADHGDEATL